MKKEPSPTPPPSSGTLQQVRTARLLESRTNPRTEFPEAALAELHASIQQRGLEEPLIAREVPTVLEPGKSGVKEGWFVRVAAFLDPVKKTYAGPELFFPTEAEAREHSPLLELIAGARRTRCARSLRLDTVPCLVKKMTDAEVQESQYVSFLHEGLSDLEEARTLQRLLTLQPGATQDERIAALEPKTGKKRATILARLTILKTCPAAQKALSEGVLSQSHLQYIAGLPAHLQDQLVKEVLAGPRYGEKRPLSVRETEELVNERYRVNLKAAPFKLDDATLCPQAGACTTCPKKQPPAICTDVACYAQKKSASQDLRIAAAKKNGQPVFTAQEWEKVRYEGKGYVDLQERNYSDPKERTWAELVKGGETKPTLAFDREGDLIEVMLRADAEKCAEKNGLKKPASSGTDWEAKSRKAQAEKRTRRESLKAAMNALLPKLTAAARTQHVQDVKFWQVLARLAVGRLACDGQGDNEAGRLINLLGLKVEAKGHDTGEKTLLDHLATLRQVDDVRVFAIQAFALAGWLEFYNVNWGGSISEFAALYGLDLKALEKEAAAKKKVPAAKAEKPPARPGNSFGKLSGPVVAKLKKKALVKK